MGHILAVQCKFIVDSGAYTSTVPWLTFRSIVHCCGPYKIANLKADIYSFGAVLYELLTGNPPFKGENIQDQVLNEVPEEIEDISPELGWIVGACLQKNYFDRHNTFEELIELLLTKQHLGQDLFSRVNWNSKWMVRAKMALAIGFLGDIGLSIFLMTDISVTLYGSFSIFFVVLTSFVLNAVGVLVAIAVGVVLGLFLATTDRVYQIAGKTAIPFLISVLGLLALIIHQALFIGFLSVYSKL